MKKLLRTALAAWAAVILLPACTVPSSYDPAVPHAVTPAVSADTPTDADPSAPKYVALTFDDGPSPRCTPRPMTNNINSQNIIFVMKILKL